MELHQMENGKAVPVWQAVAQADTLGLIIKKGRNQSRAL